MVDGTLAITAEAPAVEKDVTVEGLSMVVFSGDLDKALAAFIIANGATEMDLQVTIFFTFWGLNILRREGPVTVKESESLMEKMFGWMMHQGAKQTQVVQDRYERIGYLSYEKGDGKEECF